MKVILSYLENMFLNMPKTPEVLRAKEELASMMEDKYNELLSEGKKENEAVGIVISEFGDLGELAQELGISGLWGKESGAQANYTNVGTQFDGSYRSQGTATGSGTETMPKMVSREEAGEYMDTSAKTTRWIAVGVMLCIFSPILLIMCGAIDDIYSPLSDLQIVVFGLIPLFLMIGVAVAIFIYNGMKTQRFEYMKKEIIQIDERLDRELAARAEEIRPRTTMMIIIGVVLCIFSVIPLLLSGSMTDNDMINSMTTCLLLVIIAIAVMILIVGNSEMECIKVLRQKEDFSSANKKGNMITGIIAGIYWPLVTVVYLAWSFYTMHWGITWIVWPVAGILFGAIAGICNAIVRATRMDT